MIGIKAFRDSRTFLFYTKASWKKESIVKLKIYCSEYLVKCNTRYETLQVEKVLTKENIKFIRERLLNYIPEDDIDKKRRISPTDVRGIFSELDRTWAYLRVSLGDREKVKEILKSEGYWIVYSVGDGFKILQ